MGNRKFSNILINHFFPAIISLLIGVLFYFAIFKDLYPKYSFAQTKQYLNTKYRIDVCDLNNDSVSELILLQYELPTKKQSNFSISINPMEGDNSFSQNNFEDIIVNEAPFITTDIDGDGKKEIFVFFVHDSLLFLRGFKLDIEKVIQPYQFFVKLIDTVVVKNNGFIDFMVSGFELVDINNDGVTEICFAVNGKYSAAPRKIYYYDFVADSLHSSSSDYHFPIYKFYCNKTNKESKKIFIPSGLASLGNVSDSSKKYHDRHSWIFALNQDLKPLFDPIPLGKEEFSTVNNQIYFSHSGKEGILSDFNELNKVTTFSMVSLNGKIIKRRKFNYYLLPILPSPDTSRYICCTSDGKDLLFIDYDLNIAKRIKISSLEKSIKGVDIINIDKDKEPEYILVTNFGNTIELYDDDMSFMFSIPNEAKNAINSFKVQTRGDKNYFGYRFGFNYVIYYFKLSNKFYLSFLLSFLISVVFYFLIQLFVKQRLSIIEKHNQQEKALIEAQLKIANKQMSPHFQLNVLNAIGYLFDNDREKAQYYLGKYSRLVSNTMMNVDKITTTLENELEFTRNYLTLEQLRLDFKFDFDIMISDEVDMSIQIPRMLVFTFCENAVKHGLFHKKEKGNLRVELTGEGKNMEIKIEDNGIGRRKAGEQKTRGTGMGLKTLSKIVNHYNDMGNYKISFVINDLTVNSGTAVIIKIRKTR